MLEFKFDTKIAAFADIPRVLNTISGLSSADRSAQVTPSGPGLVNPSLLDAALRGAGVALPIDPTRAWRSLWNEIVMYGLVYWDTAQSPAVLELTPVGQLVVGGGDLQSAVLSTFSRLQFPHPLKTPESSLVPFLATEARVVPVRRAARVLVELQDAADRGDISPSQVFLTDEELYYVWACDDWLGLPDGDPPLAARRIIDHRRGALIPGHELIRDVVGQHWLSRLPVKMGYLSDYFVRKNSPTRIELNPGAASNPVFVKHILANASYFHWVERATTIAAGRATLPAQLYAAWGLYHGGVDGNEHLALEGSLFPPSGAMVSLPIIDSHADYGFTFEETVWREPLKPPAEVEANGRDAFLLEWIENNWKLYAYPFETLAAVVDAVQQGHTLLQGPPGSGKTQLAELVADMFGVHLIMATATPDWSTADTIGGPSLSQEEALKATAKNGLVTDAVLDCARSVYGIETTVSSGEARQKGVWLAIDEFNRAEIDRVFGGLFTAFSSSESRVLELPFQTDSRRRRVRIPLRFRLLATANTLDKAYVNGMSQALLRRFATVEVGIPNEPDASWKVGPAVAALRTATPLDYKAHAGSLEHEALVALERSAESGVGEPERIAALDRIYLAVLALRYGFNVPGGDDAPRVPVGTAQVIDALAFATRLIKNGDAPEAAAQRALATRVLPQVDFLSRAQLLQLASSLEAAGDSESGLEVQRMAERLPQLL